MRRLAPFCFLLIFFAASSAFGQERLPPAISHWTSQGAEVASAGKLASLAGSAAGPLSEYGARSVEQRTYAKGASFFQATLYTFQDSTGAYGAYSFLRTPEMPGADFTRHSSMSRNHALVLTGNCVLEIIGKDLARLTHVIQALSRQIVSPAGSSLYPTLPLRLPLDHLIPRSDHYILGPQALAQLFPFASGDWLGFSDGAEAELGRYRLDGQEATLLLVDYPTPQLAEGEVGKLSKEFNIHGSPSSGNQRSPLFVRRDGTLVALLAGARSEAEASSLLDQVHAGMVVTWNAPAFKLNEPSFATMIVGTIIGTAQICGFTLLGGLLFSAIRLSVKKLFPGKVFDRPSHLEIIQLGLSSKPIKISDFY